MERKGYSFEAEYVRVIRNWRRACDERGLTDEVRSHYNKKFVAYILGELIPWHNKEGMYMYDFGLLEVNQ